MDFAKISSQLLPLIQTSHQRVWYHRLSLSALFLYNGAHYQLSLLTAMCESLRDHFGPVVPNFSFLLEFSRRFSLFFDSLTMRGLLIDDLFS